MEDSGVLVKTAQVDITDIADLKSVLSPYLSASALHPLKGIFHLAGVLEDGLLINQSWENFDAVMTPKLTGRLESASAHPVPQISIILFVSPLSSL